MTLASHGLVELYPVTASRADAKSDPSTLLLSPLSGALTQIQLP